MIYAAYNMHLITYITDISFTKLREVQNDFMGISEQSLYARNSF